VWYVVECDDESPPMSVMGCGSGRIGARQGWRSLFGPRIISAKASVTIVYL
jgi:hypothetical protein